MFKNKEVRNTALAAFGYLFVFLINFGVANFEGVVAGLFLAMTAAEAIKLHSMLRAKKE